MKKNRAPARDPYRSMPARAAAVKRPRELGRGTTNHAKEKRPERRKGETREVWELTLEGRKERGDRPSRIIGRSEWDS